MEHLLVPSDGLPPELQNVPFVGYPWDGGNFMDYPERHENLKHFVNPIRYAASRHLARMYDDICAYSLEPLLQTWLFFGLLHTFFGNDFRQADFTRYCEPLGNEQIVVATAKLTSLLETWEKAQSGGFDVRRVSSLESCFETVRVCLANCRNVSFDESIHLSTASTASTAELLEHSCHDTLRREAASFATFIQYDYKFPRQQMCENGWCPFEAHVALDKTSEVAMVAYMTCLKRPVKKVSHVGCSAQQCVRSEIAFERLDQEGHTHSDGCEGCGSKGIDGDDMEAMLDYLRKDCSPLVEIGVTGHNKVRMTVVPHEAGDAYTAISHVWADGLGNPHANGLRACRALELYRLVEGLRRSKAANTSRNKPHRIWLDTLCCPVQNKSARAAVLSMMGDIYKGADATLVLDQELRNVCTDDMSPLEIIARVIFWTFEGAVFSDNLWIRFADGPKSMQTIVSTAVAGMKSHRSIVSSR